MVYVNVMSFGDEDHTGVNLTFFFGAYILYLYDLYRYKGKRVRSSEERKRIRLSGLIALHQLSMVHK